MSASNSSYTWLNRNRYRRFDFLKRKQYVDRWLKQSESILCKACKSPVTVCKIPSHVYSYHQYIPPRFLYLARGYDFYNYLRKKWFKL